MKAKTQKPKDRIDALVDNLDKYYFRFASVENELGGSEWTATKDFVDNVASMFHTASCTEAQKQFYKVLRDAEAKLPGITKSLEDAAWQMHENSYPMLVGYILGLRIAGMSSEQTKKMARTWRLGDPQDDAA